MIEKKLLKNLGFSEELISSINSFEPYNTIEVKDYTPIFNANESNANLMEYTINIEDSIKIKLKKA